LTQERGRLASEPLDRLAGVNGLRSINPDQADLDRLAVEPDDYCVPIDDALDSGDGGRCRRVLRPCRERYEGDDGYRQQDR
jgi:hypothetical protein